jgi:hypothetical protein
MIIWYISPTLVFFTKKNLATLRLTIQNFRELPIPSCNPDVIWAHFWLRRGYQIAGPTIRQTVFAVSPLTHIPGCTWPAWIVHLCMHENVRTLK